MRYYEQPRLFLDLVPVTGGPISGGTIITLGGFGFTNFDTEATGVGKSRCRWGEGGVPVEAMALNSESIVCPTSPRATAADVTLRVSINGQVRLAKMPTRSPRDAPEMPTRCQRDAHEMPPRSQRDPHEMRPRSQ